jgi:hypothetical protein
VSRKMIRADTWGLMLVLMVGGASPLGAQQTLERPPDGYRTPTIIPAGPTHLVVTAAIPARLDLQWLSVAGSRYYRITRSSSLEPTEKEIIEVNSEADRTGFYFDKLPERSGSVTFSYKVYAIFVNSDGSRTVSTPSPTGTATALQPVAPPKFKTKVMVSQLMGRLRVILEWGSVANATGYYVFQVTRSGVTPLPLAPTTVKQTTMTIDNVVPGQGGTLCVVTVYDLFYKDESARSCDLVLTSAR